VGGQHRVALACVLLLCAAPAAAQDPDSPANPRRPFWKLFTELGNDVKHLPSRDTLLWLSIGGGTALAVHRLDDDVNARLVGDPWVDDVFAPGAIAGRTYVHFAGAAITYVWGRAARQPRVAHIGVDLIRAQLMTYALTQAVKLSARRERPDGSNNRSFPSGHASITFASATVLQRHFGWRGALLYPVASYVAMSRLHENRHYLSDVIFGAALGLVAGRTVTRHGRNQWTVSPALMPDGGYALTVTVYSHSP
jgi:membrane-associated phospholipid phosphatase